MKIYQKSSFTVKGNKITCKIDCTLVLFMFGEPEHKLEISFSQLGVAICSPEDKFDEDFGKKLAERRASIRVYKKALRELNKKKRYYSGMLEEVSGGIKKSRKLRNHLEKNEYSRKK